MLSFINKQYGTTGTTWRGLSHFRAIRRARSQFPPQNELQNIPDTVNKCHHLHLDAVQRVDKSLGVQRTSDVGGKENRKDGCINVTPANPLLCHFGDFCDTFYFSVQLRATGDPFIDHGNESLNLEHQVQCGCCLHFVSFTARESTKLLCLTFS